MKNNLFFLVFFALSCLFLSCNKKGGTLTLFPVLVGNEYQYIDKDGKIIINPQFRDASVFRDGIALVQTSGDKPKWGFIDKAGHYIINAQYKYATIFSEGLAWVVSEDASPCAIDKEGEIKFTLQAAEEVRIFNNGFAAYRITSKDGKQKWGFVDTKGSVAINPQFENVGYFYDGMCAVSNESGKWGYIDESGKIIINYQFSSASIFTSEYAIVSTNNKFGTINKNGKYIINPQFDNMKKDGELFIFEQDEKSGWCDASGKIIINPQFNYAGYFLGKDVAPVRIGDKMGYVDKKGKIKINPQFDEALSFNGKLGLVSISGKYGFIDLEGKYVINPQYDISIDLIYYLHRSTNYISVTTDYFNIDAVVNRLNFESPEDLTLNSTFGNIRKHFNYGVYLFDENSYKHHIYSQFITSNVTFSFYIYGKAYQMGGDNEAYEKKFASNNNVIGFIYEISLSGKEIAKAKKLVSALVDKLVGFKKGKSTEGIMYFNETTKVYFTGNSSNISISILKPDGSETVDSDNKIIWDEENTINEVSAAYSTALVEEVPTLDSVSVEVVDTSISIVQ